MKKPIYPIIFLLFFISSCEPPGSKKNPPLPDCTFLASGDIYFSELQLHYLIPGMPTMWQNDHDVFQNGYIEDFNNVLDDNTNIFASTNDAEVKLTMTGLNCKGTLISNYSYSLTPHDYSFATLSKTPYSGDSYEVETQLVVRSADYNGVRCVWMKTFKKIGSNTNSYQAGSIYGDWQSTTKANDDGKPMLVYVHDMFNNYTYTL